MPDPDSPMIGQKLGSFLIEAELGSGAMGIVYRGVAEGKDRQVAIKVISADQIGKGKAFERFEREAEILEQFRHPNIVRYYARGRSRGTYYYAMEYVTGPTLDKVLRDRGPLGWKKVVNLGIQLCDALQYAHDRGVVHRDLKPSNLMITEKGQLKLADFGIAKALDRTALTATGRTLGTAAYMAPEQIRGTPDVSHKTDLYALGALLYQMLTNEPPFTGSSALVLMHAHINEPAPRPSKKVEEIPKALDDLVVALMAKDPTERPWDAMAVAQILRGLFEKAANKEPIPMVWPEPGTAAAMPTRAGLFEEEVGPKPEKARKKKKKKSGPSLEVVGLVGALLVVAGAIGYLLWPPSANYYYTRAAALMASDKPSDWKLGRDEYLEPLEAKYPNHPYREQAAAWRDRIDLNEARRRADILEKPNLAAFSKPNTQAEALYQHTFEEAAAALKMHHDGDAQDLWRTMVQQIAKADKADKADHGWILLATAKADDLAATIARRRDTVAGLLAKAAVPIQLAHTEAARRYARDSLRDLIARFDSYPDVADLIAQAKATLAAYEAPEKPAEEAPKPPAEPSPKP